MALALRLTGWTIFLVGAGLTLAVKPIAIGLIVSGIGVLCTMACNLLGSYAELWRRKKALEPVDPLTPDSAARARQIIRERRKDIVAREVSGSDPAPPPTDPSDAPAQE